MNFAQRNMMLILSIGPTHPILIVSFKTFLGREKSLKFYSQICMIETVPFVSTWLHLVKSNDYSNWLHQLLLINCWNLFLSIAFECIYLFMDKKEFHRPQKTNKNAYREGIT